MKRIIYIMTSILLITTAFTLTANANEPYPPLPEVRQRNYVIYREGNRGNRIELAVFDILDSSAQSLILEVPYKITLFAEAEHDNNVLNPKPQTSLTLSDNEKYYNGDKYYLDGDKWIYFESGYSKISENATEIIASNLPYIESFQKEVNDNITTENIMKFDVVDYDGAKYVGTKNFRELYISDDKIHYRSVLNEDSELRMANNSYPPIFVRGNDIVLGYIVVPDAEFADASLREYILEPLQIFDGNYNFMGKNKINFFIRDIVFYNGYFYCKTDDKNCLKTSDGNSFTDCSYDEYLDAIAVKSSNSPGSYYLDLKSNQIINKSSKQKYTIKSEYDSYNIKTSDGEKIISKYIVGNSEETKKCFVTIDGLYGITMPNDAIDGDFWYYNNNVYAIGINRIYKIPVEQFSENIMIILNDNILQFSQPPVIENDRTLVPMRFLFEQMGAEVIWDEATQTATAIAPANKDESRSVTFAIDDVSAIVNGSTAIMDVPARLINNQTFVPLRFLSENLGYTVEWDETTNTVIISTE